MCCKRARPRTGRPTSLIRDIRDRASGGNQINEASHHQGTTPRDRTRRHPPDQPGWSCNPRPPVRSTPEVPYMSQQRDGVADLFVGYGLGAAELDFGVGTDRGQLRLAAHPPALPGRFCPTDPVENYPTTSDRLRRSVITAQKAAVPRSKTSPADASRAGETTRMAPPTLTGAPTYIRPSPRSTHRARSSTAPVQRTSVNRADDLGLRHGVRIRHDDIVPESVPEPDRPDPVLGRVERWCGLGGCCRSSSSRKRPNPGQVSGRGAGEQLRSPLFQGCHLGPQAVQFAIYLRKRRLRLSFLQVVVPTCCLDECLNLRSEKAQPGIAVDGTLSVLQLAVADRLDDLVLSESELGASSLVAQGGALAPPLGFEAVDDSPLPRNGLGNGAAGDDMVSDAHAIRVLNRGYRRARGRAWAVCERQGGSGDVPDSELARRYRRIPFQITPSPAPGQARGAESLPVLPAPEPRTSERALARTGQLIEAPVVFTEGAHLPLAGLLLIPPAPAATGLTEAFVAT